MKPEQGEIIRAMQVRIAEGQNWKLWLSAIAVIALSTAFSLTLPLGVREIWWFVATIGMGIMTHLAFRWIAARRLKVQQRQVSIQHYLARIRQTNNPEERQPILYEMATLGLLRDVTLSSSDLSDLDLRGVDLRKSDLTGTTLSGTNLSGAVLSNATLSYATLSYITLHGALLNDANLRSTNFRGSDLRQADLSGAFMRGSVLHHAVLSGANLRNANLHGADMRYADLSGADLTGANLTRATLPNGVRWTPGTDISRFTDPNHSAFWQPDTVHWPIHHQRRSK